MTGNQRPHLDFEHQSAAGTARWKTDLDKATQFRKMAAGLIAKAELLEHQFSISQAQ